MLLHTICCMYLLQMDAWSAQEALAFLNNLFNKHLLSKFPLKKFFKHFLKVELQRKTQRARFHLLVLSKWL